MPVTPRDPDLSAMLSALSDRVARLERPASSALAPFTTASGPLRSGTVVASTDGGARIQITYASHDLLVAAPFPTATYLSPVVCIGDNLSGYFVDVDAATMTASGFQVVVYDHTNAAYISAGPLRINYLATGH